MVAKTQTIESGQSGPGIVTLRLNRPRVLNAINDVMVSELTAAFRDLADDASARVIVVTGAAGPAFCAGADVRELSALAPVESVDFSLKIAQLHALIAGAPQPVIAAINGVCFGGGLELALACDVRVASQSARFGLPEISLGVVPGGGGTVRLQRLVGPGIARYMVLTGDIIPAQRALEIGLVNELHAEEVFDAAVAALAERLSSLSPAGLSLAKRTLELGQAPGLAEAIRSEAHASAVSLTTEGARQGMASFLDKRDSKSTGH